VADPTVILRRRDDVAEIVLHRPHKLNAMNLAWVNDLLEAVTVVAQDKPELVVIRGEGQAFCAGMDLDMLATEGMPPSFYPRQEQAFCALEQLDRLVIAQIHGHCLGGGLQLALACDIRIVSADVVLGLPAASEGLPPGMAPWRLPRYIGLGRALRLAILGERIGADEALHGGLADHVLPADGFEEHARALIARYRLVPQAAARATKELARSAFDTDFATTYARSRELVRQCMDTADAANARAAWARRRRE
jgi:enoyl-CoA hydratase